MKKGFIFLIILASILSACQNKENDLTISSSKHAFKDESGLINIISNYNFEQTTNRLSDLLLEKGFKIIAIVPHSIAAKKVGIELRPTTLFIFGNPKLGSLLMQCNQTIALDLPQRLLIWENENHQVILTYNDPAYLQKRHTLKNCEKEVINKMSKGLENITKKVATADE